jgi:hypothetical protein
MKAVFGYLGAGLAVPLVLATFIRMQRWMEWIADTGLRVSPWFAGGEVAFSVPHDGYQTRIHEPVFLGLLVETSEGFVQVDWTPRENAPAWIDEAIDYDDDGTDDFHVLWNTQTGDIALTPFSEEVLCLEGKYALNDTWAVRVRVKNPKR